MEIPDQFNQVWLEIIAGDKQYKLQFIGTKLLLGRLRLSYKKDHSVPQVSQYTEEIRSFFDKNRHIPMAMDDLKSMLENK